MRANATPGSRFSGRSIRFRVALATTTVVAITLAIGAVVLVLLLRQLLIAGLDSSQTARAVDLTSQARTGLLRGSIPGTAADTSLVQVVSSNGDVVASTPNVSGESPILSKLPPTRLRIALTISDAPLDTGAPFRVIAEPVTLPQGKGWIYVASSLDQVDAAVNQLTTLFIVAIPLGILIIGAIAWLAVRQSLRPVESIRRRAAAITSADLSQRVPIPSGSDEIAHLATTMNDMLARIERAAKRQRQFVGDASHELRSPLAALQIQLDVALSQSIQRDGSADLVAMRDQVGRMTMLIEDLLFLATSSEPAPMVLPARVDLDELVFEEANRLRALGGPTVATKVLNAIRVKGSFRDLSRMLRNLGDNAHDHAESMIEIILKADDGYAEIIVGDDGGGIAESDRERIFERFSRLDDSRVRDTRGGGSGLGLAISRQIAESSGGTIAVRSRTDGSRGTEFVVQLPLEIETA
jgi:signal transduction histidine kinase